MQIQVNLLVKTRGEDSQVVGDPFKTSKYDIAGSNKWDKGCK